MLRRPLATLILTISLLIGTVAWSGFVALRTILDAERSEAVAEALYDDETVRNQLADNLAAAVGAAVPDGAPVSQDQLDAAARVALDSPAVEALIVDAFAATHKAFLGEGSPPDSLDAGALGAAARDALVARQPELDAVLPPPADLVVPLPTEQVPDVGFIRDFFERFVPILALVAAAGALFALVATSDRPAVLRRTGFWAIGVSAFVLLFAYGVPWLAEQFAPDQSAVIATLVGSLAETTRGPALAMAAAGLAGIAAAVLWNRAPTPIASRAAVPAPVHPPAMLPSAPPTAEPRSRRGGRSGRLDMPTGPTQAWVAAPPPTSLPVAPPSPPRPPPPAPRAPAPAAGAAPPHAAPPHAAPSDPRWVEGHGWVVDAASPDVPAEARWVPGVGYVTDQAPDR